jgi:hypothetical protein
VLILLSYIPIITNLNIFHILISVSYLIS